MSALLTSIMCFQQITAGSVPVADKFKEDSSYEEMLKNRVLYRVCIPRALHFSELAPSRRSETVVSSTSLKLNEHKPAGVGIEFKVYVHLVSTVFVWVTVN